MTESPASFSIDIHTHILPKTWPDLREKYGYGGFIRLEHHTSCSARMMKDDEFFREVQDNTWDPEVRIKECNHTNVNVQVLSTVPVMFSYWAKPEHTLDLSRFLNDHIAEVVHTYPDRFAGLGTLPMQDPDMAMAELERCKELGLLGVQIGTHVNNTNLNDPSIFAVFEAAQDLGQCIFIHPWEMMGAKHMSKYWMPWLVGMPAETSRAITSMIFGGVFEKLPKLRVAFAHGGGSFPATIGRIEHGFNVRPDLCAVDNNVNPREYLGKFYLDSLVHDESILKYIVELMGEDKIILGSDYPFPLGEHQPGQLIRRAGLSKETQGKILADNALNWLGVTRQHFMK